MKIKMRQKFADLMQEIGLRDSKLVVLVGDISHFALQPFAKACPGQFYNIGICEPTIISMGAGLSKVGLYPVLHTISPFLVERSFEQIKLDFGYQGLGGNIITVGSAFDYGALGCSHHCYDDFALLKPIPSTEITYPSSPVELEQLFLQTYRNGQISYFRLPEDQHDTDFTASDIKLGKGIRVFEGSDITLATTGPQLKRAVHARELLSHRGVSAEILYFHTIKPFDADLARDSVAKTHRVLSIEEHSMYGGLGDEIMRACKEISGVKYGFQSLGNKFVHDYGTYEQLCEKLGFTGEHICRRVMDEFSFSSRPKLRMTS